MPIHSRHKASLRVRSSKLIKRLDDEQKLADWQRKMIQLGQDERVLNLIDRLEDDPALVAAAEKNPRKLLKNHGVVLPRGLKLTVSGGSVNIHVGASIGGHSGEAGYTTGRGFYLEVDGVDYCK